MSSYDAPFEIHVHGDVPLRADVTFAQLQDALKPLWKYAGAKSLTAGAASVYEEEPGIRFDAPKHLLQMCWTVPGDEDFRQSLDEMCMGLNDLAEAGAPLEVTFYDADFDEDDGDEDDDEDEDQDEKDEKAEKAEAEAHGDDDDDAEEGDDDDDDEEGDDEDDDDDEDDE